MCFVWIWEQTAIISLYSINLTGFYNRDGVCLLRGTDWVFKCNSTLCPHSVFMCFMWIWEQTAIISLYSINLTGFYNRDGVCLLRGTDWVFKCNSTLCPHSVFVCFVWIWEQTAIISLYSINLTGFYNRDGVCLLRGTDWVFKCNSDIS